jgi:MtfA peptidase
MLPVVGLVLVFAAAYSLRSYGRRTRLHNYYTSRCHPPAVDKTDICFQGSELNLSHVQLHQMLSKRFPYYRMLDVQLQERFISRLQRFMEKKIFIIKDDEGFKDMPVLVSAAAIQLTFGLKHYRFPFYKYIRIYPEEYFAEHELFKVLTGNVQNNVISVAWNHLLRGYAGEDDGVNVGLHEMGHALYIQKMVIEQHHAVDFASQYNDVLSHCEDAHTVETVEKRVNLYSEYAESTPQEFWAESVELFFEKPAALKETYPKVYNAMQLLLNQDPLNANAPLVRNNMSFTEKIEKLLGQVTT